MRKLIAEARTIIEHAEARGEDWPNLIDEIASRKTAERLGAALREAREEQERARDVCGENIERIEAGLEKIGATLAKLEDDAPAAQEAAKPKKGTTKAKRSGKKAIRSARKKPAAVAGMDTGTIIALARANEKPRAAARGTVGSKLRRIAATV